MGRCRVHSRAFSLTGKNKLFNMITTILLVTNNNTVTNNWDASHGQP